LIDAAVAVGALAVTVALLRHGGVAPTRSGGTLDLTGLALVLCSTLPLIVWRRFPLGVVAATASASVLLAGLGYPVDLTPGPTVAVYLLAASRSRQNPWTRRTTAVVAGLFVAYLAASAAALGAFPALGLLHTGMAWAVAWFAGERTRLRREQLAESRERATRAERDTERERQLAVAEERTRIASDLHDSAGHAVNVIAVRAGAARLRHHDHPDRSLTALQAIEELARHTAAEIDQIVGTLRDRDSATADLAAPPGLASLDTLIAHHTAAGLAVAVHTTGTQRPFASAADQAAYRILQEAMTNAAHHGRGTVSIVLGFADDAIDLTVTNPTSNGGMSRPRGGHGLIGMRERATLLGGTLDATCANGTFRVHARIPCAGHGP
jgi:signal transduction histidine kinase